MSFLNSINTKKLGPCPAGNYQASISYGDPVINAKDDTKSYLPITFTLAINGRELKQNFFEKGLHALSSKLRQVMDIASDDEISPIEMLELAKDKTFQIQVAYNVVENRTYQNIYVLATTENFQAQQEQMQQDDENPF